MPTVKKEENIAMLQEMLGKSRSLILTEYKGLTMKNVDELRGKLRPEQVVFKVVKNTLLKRAIAGTEYEPLSDLLEGPTAAVFGLGDAVIPAKLMSEYAKTSKGAVTIKGGVIDGMVCDVDQVSQIAKLPSREVLLAQVVGGLQSPITNLAGTLQTMISSLVWTLQGVADQKSA